MDIKDEIPAFTAKFDSESYSRTAIVLLCMDKIRNAFDIESMNNTSTCVIVDDNVYFTYNEVCKLYFRHHPAENN